VSSTFFLSVTWCEFILKVSPGSLCIIVLENFCHTTFFALTVVFFYKIISVLVTFFVTVTLVFFYSVMKSFLSLYKMKPWVWKGAPDASSRDRSPTRNFYHCVLVTPGVCQFVVRRWECHHMTLCPRRRLRSSPWLSGGRGWQRCRTGPHVWSGVTRVVVW
jgi:hypothetical protein